jgi:hypothetical protein
MKEETIHQIISDKNKDSERETMRSAELLIIQIASCQGKIEEEQKKITEFRKELKALNFVPLDPKVLLGGE